MTPADRRLLEMAAKAAGHVVVRESDDGWAVLLYGEQEPWNPLESSEQALALAVRNHMALTFSADGNCHAEGLNGETYACERSAAPLVSARLAITRCAAAIGEGME